MIDKKRWRRARVVVEIPVRGDALKERQLRALVSEALGPKLTDSIRRVVDRTQRMFVGAWRVVEYGPLVRAEALKIPDPPLERELRALGINAVARLACEFGYRRREAGVELSATLAELEGLLTGKLEGRVEVKFVEKKK